MACSGPGPDQKSYKVELRAHLGGELIVDSTGFRQDAVSLAQVGAQVGHAEVRSAWLQVSGNLWDDNRLSYRIAAQYKGFDAEPQSDWVVTDAAITFTGASTRISVGRISSVPQSERVLSSFAASRNNGANITQVLGADRRSTLSIDIYDETWGFEKGGLGLSARATRLVWQDGADYLHIGLSYRQFPASGGQLRYSGRPASNVASNFVDTGNFSGEAARHYGIEGLYSVGGAAVQAEHVIARTDAVAAGNPVFHGLYVLGS